MAAACLDSVVSQTYGNLQIIISEYGNDDISNQYADDDSRIIVLHGQNNGMCPARNAGLDAAKGEWICFIDGDDYIDSHFVEYLLKAVLNWDCLVGQCKFKTTISKNEIAENQLCKSAIFELSDFVLYNEFQIGLQNVCLWDKIWHKSLFAKICFPDEKNGFDLITICELIYTARHKKFAVVDCFLYFYVQSPNSSSRTRSLRTLDAWKYDYIGAAEFWKNKEYTKIYEIFYKYAFNVAITLALECMRDIPQHQNEISLLIEYVKRELDYASLSGYNDTNIRLDAWRIWEYMEQNSGNVILYGFGRSGRFIIYPWLKYFGIRIQEIWDTSADDDVTDGLPLRKAHSGVENALICIAIEDQFISSQAETKLRNLGYVNFLRYPSLWGAIKYTAYKKFMPFLLDGSLRI
jgi:glycosyltransferase involved in cell wall biosynthesis